MGYRLGFCFAIGASALALACVSAFEEPPARGVMVTTDALEYTISSPPRAAAVTVENHSDTYVGVRRCLSSPNDPVGLDVVVEAQVNKVWQPVDIGFDCVAAHAPRDDALLAPGESTLVLRLIATTPGRFRVRVGYGPGGGAAPVDTATSPTFVYR